MRGCANLRSRSISQLVFGFGISKRLNFGWSNGSHYSEQLKIDWGTKKKRGASDVFAVANVAGPPCFGYLRWLFIVFVVVNLVSS